MGATKQMAHTLFIAQQQPSMYKTFCCQINQFFWTSDQSSIVCWFLWYKLWSSLSWASWAGQQWGGFTCCEAHRSDEASSDLMPDPCALMYPTSVPSQPMYHIQLEITCTCAVPWGPFRADAQPMCAYVPYLCTIPTNADARPMYYFELCCTIPANGFDQLPRIYLYL